MQQDDYYQIDRISNSYLSDIKRKIQGLPDKKNSNALKFGSGLHCMLLEPEKFDYREYTGRDRMQMMKMVKSVKDVIDPKLLEGEKEMEIYYSFMGLECKLKADIVNDDCICDIKTTATSTAQDFLKSAIEYDYIRQAAWYLDCPFVKDGGINRFVIVGISKIDPYPVFLYELDRHDPLIEAGREEYLFLLDYIKNSCELSAKYQSILNTESIIKKVA